MIRAWTVRHQRHLWFTLAFLATGAALAAEEAIPPHQMRLALWFFNGAAGLLVAIVGFLIVYTLQRLNRTIDRMDEKLDGVETRVASLEGFRDGWNARIRST